MQTKMRRACGIAFGVFTHGLFFFTVYHLSRFLHADTVASPPGSLAKDALLAGQFAVIHSLLLHPSVRQRLTKWIPRAFYGCFFCVATCVTLLVVFFGWQSAEPTVWRLTGWAKAPVEAMFFASWAGLFYSLYLSGLGYQTGFTPWRHWLQGRPLPNREFRPRSVYLVLRHPVYLSFMGLVWFNPVMTLDRLLLAVVWSVYIFIGSYLKDERLAYFLGKTYRLYQERVPGYPFMPVGPLARRKPSETSDVIPLSPARQVSAHKAA